MLDLFFIDSIGANDDEDDYSEVFERFYSYDILSDGVLGRQETQDSLVDALDGRKKRDPRYAFLRRNLWPGI
jgi:hypothetical protein